MDANQIIGEALRCWAEGPDAARLESLGWTAVRTYGPGEVHVTGPSGTRVMLSQGLDLYAITASLALGQWGPLWPVVCPTLLEDASLAARRYQAAINDRTGGDDARTNRSAHP